KEACDPDFIDIVVRDVLHCYDIILGLGPFLDFCASVEQCKAHSAGYARAGLNVPAVNGSLSRKQDAKLLADIRKGRVHGRLTLSMRPSIRADLILRKLIAAGCDPAIGFLHRR